MATAPGRKKEAAAPPSDDSKIIRRQLAVMGLVLGLVAGAWLIWQWGEKTGWGNPDRAVKMRMESAQQAVVDRNLRLAADIYEDLLGRYPEHPQAVQALTQLAGTYHELREHQGAVRAYSRLMKGLEGNAAKADLRAFTLLQIAKLHRETGDTELALSNLGRVRLEYPGTDWSGEAQSEIGGVYQDLGRHEEAIAAYQKVIAELPRGFLAAEAQGKIGECHEAQGDYRAAIRAYQKVLDDYPSAVWDPAKEKIEALKKKLASQKEKSGKAG